MGRCSKLTGAYPLAQGIANEYVCIAKPGRAGCISTTYGEWNRDRCAPAAGANSLSPVASRRWLWHHARAGGKPVEIVKTRNPVHGKATSFDIAYEAGVSQSTVSRALRGSPTEIGRASC